MNKTRRSILPFLILAAALTAVSAAAPGAGADPGLRDLTSAAQWAELGARGEISRSFFSGSEGLKLAPEVPAAEALRSEVSRLNPNIAVEVLMLIDTPLSRLHEPQGLRELYNTLRSISTMKGIQYFSASRNRMRTLFEESYVVQSAEKPARRPDPLVSEIPAEDRLTIHQKDLTTGSNTYTVEYRFDGAAISMVIRNLEPISYLFVPMVQPMDSVVSLIAVPRDGQILLYGLSCMRSRSVFGLERKKEDSLYNRIKAISGWLRDELIRRAGPAGG